jgi:hypothetical protein
MFVVASPLLSKVALCSIFMHVYFQYNNLEPHTDALTMLAPIAHKYLAT